ncbi:hypothetical protein MMC14_004168 [Varicellaria rhodocarpa]|nr:hypothetical protein [Varicellaria rhodocarpa]
MSSETTSVNIDSTPLSPTTQPHRRDSLEKHLQTRPDPQDLKDRNILLDTNAAPALQSTALDLARQRTIDSLKKGLEKRPEREELIERNILPNSTAAAAIQGPAKELERRMRRDSLEKKVQQRPKAEDLKREGILEGDD